MSIKMGMSGLLKKGFVTQTAGTAVHKEGQTPVKPRYQPTGKVPTQEAGDTEWSWAA